MQTGQRVAVVSLLLVVMSLAGLASGQPAKLPGGQGLMGYAPKGAVFFLERRGHQAVKKAFAASNLGKMARDDDIYSFVHGSRVRIGELIVRRVFSLENIVEVRAHQRTLHGLLKPFWHQPSALFVMVSKAGPEFVFLCQTGDYQKECSQALDKLMSIGLPPDGDPGKRQAFSYKSSGISWKGVALGRREFKLDADPAKLFGVVAGKTVFMVAWKGKTLCLAMSLPAADRVSGLLARPDPAKSILANQSVHAVANKTNIKDWAFRWHLNPEPLFELFGDRLSETRGAGKLIAILGIDQIRGIGGVGGYLDNVYTRMTYVDAPNTPGLFKQGGDFKKALSMTPGGSSAFLAGQFDTQWISSTVNSIMGLDRSAQPRDRKNPENPRLKQFNALLSSTSGNGSIFLTSLTALMAGGRNSKGFPIGFVMDIKDQNKANEAMDALAKKMDASGGRLPATKFYRKVKVVPMNGPASTAVMKDRLILALSQTAMTAAIDAALDKSGGFKADSKGDKLLKLAGDGSAVFQMDLAEVVNVLWPKITPTDRDKRNGSHPFVSVPPVSKIAGMLGPEIIVFKPDKRGLLMKSRGKIPFVTKILSYFAVTLGGAIFSL